jgi:hypothetical protein
MKINIYKKEIINEKLSISIHDKIIIINLLERN